MSDLGLFRYNEVEDAKVGDRVTYIGYRWKVI